MFTSMRKITLAAVAGAASLLMPVQDAHAGPFLDWLFGRPILVYPSPTVAGYAPVPVSAPVAVAPGIQTNYYAPACPVAAPCAVAPQITVAQPVISAPYAAAPYAVQPVIAGYAPNYRTIWNRVPVTNYRPVTTYGVAGYPTVAGQPCNTYAVQAQRVPTFRNRPWIPFGAATTYGYAPAATTLGYAPVATTYSYAPTPTTTGYTPAPNAYGYGPAATSYGYAPAATTYGYAPAATTVMSAPAAAPAYMNYPVTGAAPVAAPCIAPPVSAAGAPAAGEVFSMPAQSPTSGFSSQPADQAPALLQGDFPVSPAGDASTPPSSGALNGGVLPVTPFQADSASARRESNSPYRVTPIPAPDLRTFESQRRAPQAPPLLNGRERTVIDSSARPTNVENASWATSKPIVNQPSTTARQPTTKPLWNESGWRSAK